MTIPFVDLETQYQAPKNGEQIPLPVTGQGRYTCPHTGQVYELGADGVLRVKE